MNILDFIEEAREFYDTKTIPLHDGDEFSQKELFKYVNFNRRSKYMEEASDNIIGDYPYDNVTKYRIRLEARATDFDTKHIETEPLNGSREARVSAMIATKVLQKKMRAIRLGRFLNQYSGTRPEYGGFLCKKTADGIHKVPWENVITDMSDILSGVIIERHYMRPSELKKTNWKNVDSVIKDAARKKKEKDMDKSSTTEADTINHLIEIWEMHGEITKSVYLAAVAQMDGTKYEPKDDDDYEFVQCQVICAPLGKDKDGKMQGAVLQANEETEFPYDYDARNPMSGRGIGEGIPEELKEHQRWHNFYKTEEARAVAIGGKVLFVTDDGTVADTIYDEGIEHGTIMRVGEGRMFQQLSTVSTGVPLFQNIIQEWETSGDKATSSFNAVMGEEAAPGTPYKAQYLQDVNGNGQFLQYREEMGEWITNLVNKWLLPDALADAASDDEIYETFSKAELQLIDEVIIEKRMIDERARILLEEKRAVSSAEMEELKAKIQSQLDKQGTKRSIDGIKDFIKREVIGNVVIHTTDEQRSKAILFESYSNALALFAETDPARLAIRDRILDQMGVTKEELSLYAEEAKAVAMQQEQQAPQFETTQLKALDSNTLQPA